MTGADFPDKLGEYDILGELGRGAMGVVYLARKLSLPDRQVALKEVQVLAGVADRVRKMREAKALLQVQSVHIVALHDVFEIPERSSLCIVMEKLNAETLRDRITANPEGMEPDAVIEILDAVLDALEAAHAAKDHVGQPAPIVHRDLKPENIGFQEWRGGELPKVLDFGVARIVENEADAKTTLAAYTPAYAAPEVLRGDRATPAADLFSTGVLAWEMLVGRHPLADARGRLPSPAVVQTRIMSDPIAALPDHLLPRIPEALVDLVRDLCAHDVSLRPSPHEARDRLARGRGAGASLPPVRTSTAAARAPVTAPQPTRPETKGRGRAVLLAALLVLVVGGGGAWFVLGSATPLASAPGTAATGAFGFPAGTPPATATSAASASPALTAEPATPAARSKAPVGTAGGNVGGDLDDIMRQVRGVGAASDDGGGALRAAGGSADATAAPVPPPAASRSALVLDPTAGSTATAAGSADGNTAAPERQIHGRVRATGGSEIGGTGVLDAGEVRRVINFRIAAIKECYERRLQSNPTMEGRITVRFTISGSGTVSAASATENTLGDADVGSCVASVFRGLRFTAPEGGSVTYSFPFVFQPTE